MPPTTPEHPQREPPEELYRRLMDLHEQVFSEQRFETAYHVLAAALHVAEELDSLKYVSTIEQMAAQRQAEIDRDYPGHLLSSPSSHGRKTVAHFNVLALIAKAAGGRMRADHALDWSREG